MCERDKCSAGGGRKRIIGLRLTMDEFSELERNWKGSTIRKLSEFVRRLVFGKRVTVYTRNRSADEMLEELVILRRELHAIGVNLNQAVRRLNGTDHSPQMRAWLERFNEDRDRYFELFDEVRLKINSISAQWLQ